MITYPEVHPSCIEAYKSPGCSPLEARRLWSRGVEWDGVSWVRFRGAYKRSVLKVCTVQLMLERDIRCRLGSQLVSGRSPAQGSASLAEKSGMVRVPGAVQPGSSRKGWERFKGKEGVAL